MDPDKVTAVEAWPTPKSVRAFRGFLGLIGYYCKFIKGYGEVVAPLTKLLKKESFRWYEEADQAFQVLKVALTSALVL